MITVCKSCGNYTVLQGSEVEGARTLIKKLRLQLADPQTRQAVLDQKRKIDQLALEIELLSSSINGQHFASAANDVRQIEPERPGVRVTGSM